MSKLNKILLVIFAVQTALIFILAGSSGALSVVNKSESLLGLSMANIAEFRIIEKDKTLRIIKDQNGWSLPEAKNFPVEKSKVEDVFSEVLKIKAGFPVGTTAAATKQFKTAENDFEKQLIIKNQDGAETVLYIGKSPAFRQSYVRKKGSDETYAVEFEGYKLATDTNSWFSRSLLKVERSELESLKFNDIEVIKVNDKFTLPDIKENEEVKTEGMEVILKGATEISYTEMPTEEKPADFDALPLVQQYKMKVKGQEQEVIMRGPIKKKEEEGAENYYLKSTASPYYFKVTESAVAGFGQTGRGMLVAERLASVEPAAEK